MSGCSARANDFERAEKARQKSSELKCIIVLKGHHTAIALPNGTVFFNSTGNPGMATAGSGDVLTGLLTGLLAQGYSSSTAAILGVYLHGAAGEWAAKQNSMEAMIAGDIIDDLGKAFLSLDDCSLSCHKSIDPIAGLCFSVRRKKLVTKDVIISQGVGLSIFFEV